MQIEELLGYHQKWLHTNEHIKDLKNNFIFSETYHDVVISHLWYNNIRAFDDLYQLSIRDIDSYLEKFDVLYEAAFAAHKILNEGREIFIYTDYDTDGGLAASILIDFLKKAYNYKINENLFWATSIRAEGYGISKNVVTRILERHPNAVVFILDTGGSSYSELNKILSRREYTIILDHHNITEEVESLIYKYNNLYLVNPKAYGYRPLYSVCSGLLSYLFVRTVSLFSGRQELYELSETYVDCAAMATIADYMPYSGINSLIVHSGFNQHTNRKRIFFEELTKDNKYATKSLRDFVINVGWYLAPRLNAAGRSSNADIMLKTILLGMDEKPEDAKEFQELVKKLNEIYQNVRSERTEYETHITSLISEKYGAVSEDTDYIVVFTDNVQEAPLSSVITKMVFKYNVPMFIFANKIDRWSGSGRLPKDLISFYPDSFDILKNNGVFKVNGHYGAFGVLLYEMEKTSQVEKAVEEFVHSLGDYKRLLGMNKSFMHGYAMHGSEVMQVCNEIKSLGIYKSDDSPKFLIDTSIIELQRLGQVIKTNNDDNNNVIRVTIDKNTSISLSTIKQSKYAIASYDINSNGTPTIIIHDAIKNKIDI
jgi:single-stranded DNA-specific DHH superfamily exonuclease